MAWILLGIIIALLVYLYIQNYLIDVTNYTVTIPKVDEGFVGKKIVQITDMHLQKRTNKGFVNAYLSKIEALEPDYIMITGDIVQAGMDHFDDTPLRHFAEEIGKIAPTYAVTGNHDIASASFEVLHSILNKFNIHLLLDEATLLTLEEDPSATLVLMGLAERQNQDNLPKPMLQPIELTTYMEGKPKILMAHRPEHFEHYMDDKTKMPDLVLSGHSHAGQARIPFVGGLYAPGQGWLPKYDYGIFNFSADRSKRMIISRGLGNSSFPFRINNRPEIVVVTLK